jgi:16S rRNA pseudouridine516 synthase
MFNKLNNKVVYLKRIKIGELNLDSTLELGEYRYLTEEEIILLTK